MAPSAEAPPAAHPQAQQDLPSTESNPSLPSVPGAPHKYHDHPIKKFLYAHWTEQAARTTAILAVLAAVASSQYALQLSRTILAQAEATDEWNYYSAKSIKKHLTESEHTMLLAMAAQSPQAAAQLQPLIDKTKRAAEKYDHEGKEIQQAAQGVDALKKTHQKQGERFNYAFLFLQAGVVLCTVASSAKKKALWLVAVVAGVGGLVMLGDGYLLLF